MDGGSGLTDRLGIEGCAESLIVGEGSHGDGQLPNGPQVDGLLVGSLDEGIHPPVGPLRQQVNKGLQEAYTQVLQVLGGLYFPWCLEEDVPLWSTWVWGRGGGWASPLSPSKALGVMVCT